MKLKGHTATALTLILLINILIGFCSTPVKAEDEWIPIIPSPFMVGISVWTANQTYIGVSIAIGDPCFKVNWGNITRDGCVLWANSETWDWGGCCIQMISPPLSHTYEVGYLETGYYTFTFKAWDNEVKTITFSISSTLQNQTVPSMPRNLQAIPGGSQVVLTWQAPSSNGGASITNYRIYRSESSGNESLLTILGNVLTYIDINLVNGHNYYYRISAVNGIGEGNLSMAVSGKPATVPNPPHNLLILIINGKIVLSWQAPSNNGGASITSYNIYRGTSPGNETYLVTINNISSFTDTNLTYGQTYYYRISAVNVMGESSWSAEVIAIVSISENGNQILNVIIIILLGAVVVGISGYFIHFSRKIKRLERKIIRLPKASIGKATAKSWKMRSPESFGGKDQIKHRPLSDEWNNVLSTLEKEFAVALLNGIRIDEPNILEEP